MPSTEPNTAEKKKDANFASYLTFRLDLLKTEMIRGANIVYRRELGLDVRSLRVLRAICDAPGTTSTAVQERTLLEKTVLSKIVADLIRRKFVRRTIHPQDARHYQLWPTASGTRARVTSDELGQVMEEQMLSGLTVVERREFHRILDKLVTELRSAAQTQKKDVRA